MKKLYKNFTKNEIINILQDSNTYDEALIRLGYKANGANRTIIRNLAAQFNISLKHFINGQTINLLNQKFGKLTVIKKVQSQGNGARWLCQCDCGSLKEVDANHLRRGNIVSCGCQRSENICKINKENKLIDLVGQKFGKLTVMSRADNIGKQPAWICHCECGTITHPILGSNLKRGATQSCGCLVSQGEAKIRELLTQHNIKFDTQVKFNDCLSTKNAQLKFDFGIYDDEQKLQYLIEYQGIQHYYEVNWTHDSLNERKERDKIKMEYCHKNNIPLIIIPYTKFQTLDINDLILKEDIIK